MSAAVATAAPRAYLRRVSLTRLIRFLTVLALVLSPLATIGGAAASAMAHHMAMAADSHQVGGHYRMGDPSTVAMSHCRDTDEKSKGEPCKSSDCLTACAAVPAIPAIGGQLEPHVLAHGPRQPPALVSAPPGLVPEAPTPPPRALLNI